MQGDPGNARDALWRRLTPRRSGADPAVRAGVGRLFGRLCAVVRSPGSAHQIALGLAVAVAARRCAARLRMLVAGTPDLDVLIDHGDALLTWCCTAPRAIRCSI